MKIKFKLLILVMVVLHCFLLGNMAMAYSGKIFIAHTAISAANLGAIADLTVSVYSNSVDQTGVGGTPPTNYTIDKNGSYQGNPGYIAIDVLASTGSTVYCLLKGNNRYAIPSAALGDPVGPDQVITSVTPYIQGKPVPPIVANDGINAGFETAQIKWTLDPNYQYNGIYFKLSKASDLSAPINDSNNQPQTNVNGKSPYAFGEYVDGRKLDSGTKYYIGLWGTVAGVNESSDYSTNGKTESGTNVLVFTTKSGGAAVATTETWTFKAPVGKTHINTFAIPFVNLATVSDEAGVTRDISTVGELIAEINRQAGQAAPPVVNPVTVFGWYDEGTQTHKGLTSITEYNADGTVKTATATGGTVADILGASIVTDQPYQVSVNQEVTFKLKGFKQ